MKPFGITSTYEGQGTCKWARFFGQIPSFERKVWRKHVIMLCTRLDSMWRTTRHTRRYRVRILNHNIQVKIQLCFFYQIIRTQTYVKHQSMPLQGWRRDGHCEMHLRPRMPRVKSRKWRFYTPTPAALQKISFESLPVLCPLWKMGARRTHAQNDELTRVTHSEK